MRVYWESLQTHSFDLCLQSTLMIRRTKAEVASQLPDKIRCEQEKVWGLIRREYFIMPHLKDHQLCLWFVLSALYCPLNHCAHHRYAGSV